MLIYAEMLIEPWTDYVKKARKHFSLIPFFLQANNIEEMQNEGKIINLNFKPKSPPRVNRKKQNETKVNSSITSDSKHVQ